MKTLKNTLTILLIAFISVNINAQKTGCVSGDCLEGKGKYIEKTTEYTSTYEGAFKRGEKCGNGIFTGLFNDGTKLVYTGLWKDGKKNGKGTEVYLDINGIEIQKYIGDWKDDDRNGQGIQTHQNQNGIEIQKYIGEWKNDKQHGQGELYENGKLTHKGYFKNAKIFEEGCLEGDCENGKGTYITFNDLIGIKSSKYTGFWENGKKNGEGTIIIYDIEGKEEKKFVGVWTWEKSPLVSEPSGTGKEYNYGELVYEGDFKMGLHHKTTGCIAGDCKNGLGVFLASDKNKSKYIGQWKDGKRNGVGLMFTAERKAYYIANWKNNKETDNEILLFNFKNTLVNLLGIKYGKKFSKLIDNNVTTGCVKGDCENGFGQFTSENGTKYLGQFNNGEQHGYGTVLIGNAKFIGKFHNGKLTGYGKEYNKERVVIKQGKWLNGVFQEGSSIEKKYSKDEKCIVGNCIEGFGIFIETFEPGWSDAYRDYVNTFEIKYEGFWKNGEFQGLGYTEDRMAKKQVGVFKNGKWSQDLPEIKEKIEELVNKGNDENSTFVDAYTASQTQENQKRLECKLFGIIIQNSVNNYTYITGKEKENESSFTLHYYKKQMPNRFIDHYINKKNGIFSLTTYTGSNKNKAEEAFIQLYNSIINGCLDSLNKEMTLIKDDKENYLKTGNRTYFLTTATDNILIKIKLRKGKVLDHHTQLVDEYDASISFISLEDKQKVIDKILNEN
jgi:hypothetical protein